MNQIVKTEEAHTKIIKELEEAMNKSKGTKILKRLAVIFTSISIVLLIATLSIYGYSYLSEKSDQEGLKSYIEKNNELYQTSLPDSLAQEVNASYNIDFWDINENLQQTKNTQLKKQIDEFYQSKLSLALLDVNSIQDQILEQIDSISIFKRNSARLQAAHSELEKSKNNKDIKAIREASSKAQSLLDETRETYLKSTYLILANEKYSSIQSQIEKYLPVGSFFVEVQTVNNLELGLEDLSNYEKYESLTYKEYKSLIDEQVLSIIDKTISIINGEIEKSLILEKKNQEDLATQAEMSELRRVNLIKAKDQNNYINFSPQDFLDLQDNYEYNFVNSISQGPGIFDDVEVDKYIQQKAEERGYRLRFEADGVKLIWTDGYLMQKEAAEAWENMKKAASEEGVTLYLVSALRDISDQKKIFVERFGSYDRNLLLSGTLDQQINNVLVTSSIPGYSKHHTGYTIDIGDPSAEFTLFKNTDGYNWISANNYSNAVRFGFVPSYPEGGVNMGPNPEAWEYVWVGK